MLYLSPRDPQHADPSPAAGAHEAAPANPSELSPLPMTVAAAIGGRAKRRRLPSTPIWVATSLALMLLAGFVASSRALEPVAMFLGIAAAAVILCTIPLALCRGLAGVAVVFREARRGRSVLTMGPEVLSIVGNFAMAYFGTVIAYMATFGFARGRQVRRLGKIVLPTLQPDGTWTSAGLAAGSRDAAPRGLAEQWRENGKTEHASVAAFARLTLDLMALGAPPRLVAAANRDALDEIRHTELCLSLAASLDGRQMSPAPFPQVHRGLTLPKPRRLALAKLAVDSMVDGALHEGVSARIIAKLARRREVPAVRAVLKEIAADEGRHAAHGWAVVEWCLAEGGAPVAHALVGALRSVPTQLRSELPPAAGDGSWEHWGIHGHALETAEYSAALDHLRRRVTTMASRFTAKTGTPARAAA